jgi:hypothetical protein
MTAPIRPRSGLLSAGERASARRNGAGQDEVTAVTEVLSAKLPVTTPGPGTAVGHLDATSALRGDATWLRCGGCGASATLAPSERHYGQLVHGFVDRHESCGGAVTLRGSRGNDC